MNDSAYEIDYESAKEFALNSLQFHSLELSRFSSLFISQIQYLHENRILCTHQIMDEIKSIENGSSSGHSKKMDRFRHSPLIGLWKKHFTNPRFILENINNHNKFELFSESMESYIEIEIAKGKTLNEIVHSLTVESYLGRTKRKELTGEWIVFSKFKEKNFYLTLAGHDEGDDSIFKRIKCYCKNEFPFLPELTDK